MFPRSSCRWAATLGLNFRQFGPAFCIGSTVSTDGGTIIGAQLYLYIYMLFPFRFVSCFLFLNPQNSRCPHECWRSPCRWAATSESDFGQFGPAICFGSTVSTDGVKTVIGAQLYCFFAFQLFTPTTTNLDSTTSKLLFPFHRWVDKREEMNAQVRRVVSQFVLVASSIARAH
jgi:hypothetical protein